jgi:hypothetical protein
VAGEYFSGHGNTVRAQQRPVGDQHTLGAEYRIDASSWGVAEVVGLPEYLSERAGMRDDRLAEGGAPSEAPPSCRIGESQKAVG